MAENTQNGLEVLGSVTPIIEKLDLITSNDRINLSQQLVELQIYEDIFSPVLTGLLRITDNLNIFDSLPIVGNEKLNVKLYSWNYNLTNNDDVNYMHRTFDILRITDVTQVNDYSKQYTLHFASPELKNSESFRLSKGFYNTTHSNVISKLLTGVYEFQDPQGLGFPTDKPLEKGKNKDSPFLSQNDIETHYSKIDDEDSIELFVEKTKYVEPVLSFPYMKPLEIISWLAAKSLRSSSGRYGTRDDTEAANFLFFENKRGFQFVSIDTLLEEKENYTTRFLYGAAAQNRSKNRQVKTERIKNIQIQDCYDILKNLRNGVYSSRLHTYDLQSGNVKDFNYNYIDSFEDSESTERITFGKDYPFISHNDRDLSERYLSKRMFIVDSPGREFNQITSEFTERCNSNKNEVSHEEYLQKRLSQLGRLTNYRAIMSVAGNSKHKVGDMAYIDIKTPTVDENKTDFTEESNKYYSGLYLITSISHNITKFDYNMNIEVVKDAFKTRIE